MSQPPTAPRPSRLLFAFMVFCGVYPLITLLAYIFAPITGGWPIWARNLVMTPFMVLAMVFIIIPTIQRILSRRR